MNMNLKQLSDLELLAQTERTVAQERELTGLVLDHLREIETRRLFAKLGYSSLFRYCVEKLRYCNASAQLRIDAMRLSKEVPEVREKLDSGTVTLSSVGTLQKFFRHQAGKKAYSPEDKKELLDRIENQSKEETEKLLTAIDPQALPQERERVLTPTEKEIRLVADSELQDLLRQMKEKLGDPGISYQDLLKATLKKALGIPGPRGRQKKPEPASSGEVTQERVSGERGPVTRPPAPRREYIPVQTRREVRARAGERCTYVSEITGQRCTQTHGLQFEHRTPWARGGRSDAKNLTLLCPSHNRLRAIEVYGAGKMRSYLRI